MPSGDRLTPLVTAGTTLRNAWNSETYGVKVGRSAKDNAASRGRASSFRLRFMLVWLPLLALAAAVTGTLYLNQLHTSRTIAQVAERQTVRLAVQTIKSEFKSVRSDALYLADEVSLRGALPHDGQYDGHGLGQAFLAFARRKRLYDQIRLLDADGREMVRVDIADGQALRAPQRQLQDKSGRYYFKDALSEPRGGVYVSPFDLNIEHGHIELPIKPTIRFATPVYDSSASPKGVVVLNFVGQSLLDRLRAIGAAGGGELWLLNDRGYWLLGPKPEYEWGMMFPERSQRTVAQRFSGPWKRMVESRTGGQWRDHGALFTYQSLSVSDIMNTGAASDHAPRWWIVAYLPADAIAAQTSGLATRHLWAFAVLALVVTMVASALAQASTRRLQAEDAVRASEAHLRGLLEAAPDAVIISDAEGRIVLVNAQAESLFGYRRDELVGQAIEMLVPIGARKRHVDHRAAYRAKPHPRAMGIGLELSGQRKDGSQFPVAVSLSPVRTDSGMLIFSDIRDVTEQSRLHRRVASFNRTLSIKNRELETVNRELEAFSYSVSHDLRAPLRAIDGFSQALIEDYSEQLDDVGRDYLGRVRAAAQRMGHLIDDLLKLSRVARSGFRRQQVDISTMARDIADELRVAEPRRQVDIQIEPNLRLWADADLMRVLLTNLLSNAWKFTGNRDAPRIEVGTQTQRRDTVFFVRDNGAGFDMRNADRLFGPFQRLHDSQEFSGTGIGLATVQRIVHRHGGRIWAESQPDEGATFYFSLPPEEISK